MTTPGDENGSGGYRLIGEALVIGERTLIPVIAAWKRRFGEILMGSVRLEGLIIVEHGTYYAPFLPPGKTLDEFLCAVPGLREQVDRLLCRA